MGCAIIVKSSLVKNIFNETNSNSSSERFMSAYTSSL
jgi:hypothetical protein